jgi:small-conductance mechanosensitive channel
LAAAVGQVARTSVFVAAGLIAVAELGIDITLLTAVLSVTLLALLGAFSLAFGLGARTAVSNIIGAHYVRQTVEVGQRIRINGIDGTVAAITTTAVVLRVADGTLVIPARQFTDAASLLVGAGEPR